MDSRYVPIYKQAAAMQHQFHDYSHHYANNPQAVVLRNEIHNLTNDLAANKHPRTIEHRLQTIQNQIRMAQTYHPGMVQGSFNAPILNPHESTLLHKNFEIMRHSIRMNPHY
jgi:hypothetical protein